MGDCYDKLPANYQRFVDEWIITFRLVEAAKAAGSKAKNLSQAGRELLRKPEISAAVDEMQRELSDSLDITPERVLKEYARIGFADPRNLWDKEGNIKPVHELSLDEAAAIGGIDIAVSKTEDGKASQVLKKIKLWDKRGALDSLAKHLGLFERDNEQKKDEINLNSTLPGWLEEMIKPVPDRNVE